MNGEIVSKDNIRLTPPNWQHPILPAPFTQGNILMTINEGTTPIEDSSNLKWFKMEDVIGIANIKMEYDPESLEYKIWKTKGHLDNNGEWHYEWELVGTIDGLDPNLKNLLERIEYVEYTYTTSYSTTNGGHLIVKGIRKDETEDILCDIQFITPSVFSEVINEISNKITSETTRATTAEQQLRSDLTSEITRATGAEQQLVSDLSSEVNRATGAEQQLASDLTSEITRATMTENELSSRISSLEVDVVASGNGTSVVDSPTGKKVNVEVGAGIKINTNTNKVECNVDGTTITTNAQGKLVAPTNPALITASNGLERDINDIKLIKDNNEQGFFFNANGGIEIGSSANQLIAEALNVQGNKILYINYNAKRIFLLFAFKFENIPYLLYGRIDETYFGNFSTNVFKIINTSNYIYTIEFNFIQGHNNNSPTITIEPSVIEYDKTNNTTRMNTNALTYRVVAYAQLDE